MFDTNPISLQCQQLSKYGSASVNQNAITDESKERKDHFEQDINKSNDDVTPRRP
jgi:hypothetical protein